MSLNWKEINVILDELSLPGMQIQKAIQADYDVLALKLHGHGKTHTLLICLGPGACRLHETFRSFPKNDKPLRFAQFLNSRIVNSWIIEASQLGDNRIVRLLLRTGEQDFRLYLRLWSNAANVIATDCGGTILDAMKRHPKRGEISGGHYDPDAEFALTSAKSEKYRVRQFNPPPEGQSIEHHYIEERSFNAYIDAYYAEHAGALSLEALQEEAKARYEAHINRLGASLEKLRAKEAAFANAERFKEYGDIILSNASAIKHGDAWLEAENFYSGASIRISLDPHKIPAAMAEHYYEEYRKAKKGLVGIRGEIAAGEAELKQLELDLERLLTETNPLILNKLLKNKGQKTNAASAAVASADKKRPGLSFRRNDWLLIVGRDAAENDDLLRHHVKGGDLWLHARDVPGSYVFIKQKPGKSYPLDILLDAAHLALFYSKGRNNGAGDLFYTPVKYLRRAKNGPKGLVIPTQEKNLHVKLDEQRLKELESCRIEKI
ncbi:NFACT RNA binding domain-containing protein [Breznakiellaceae bacterium SP9]